MATTLLRRLVDDIATSPLSAVAEALRATVVHATPGTAREGVPITVKANVCVKNFTGNAASHALSGMSDLHAEFSSVDADD